MFTRDDLVNLLHATPFTPFRLHLSDGGTVDVMSREFVTAGRRFAVVGVPDSEGLEAGWDRYLRVYYMHVTRSETLWPAPPPASPPPSGPSESPAGSPARP